MKIRLKIVPFKYGLLIPRFSIFKLNREFRDEKL